METPERYWSGLYWDGFSPEAIGAIPLSTAISDHSHRNYMLHYIRKQLNIKYNNNNNNNNNNDNNSNHSEPEVHTATYTSTSLAPSTLASTPVPDVSHDEDEETEAYYVSWIITHVDAHKLKTFLTRFSLTPQEHIIPSSACSSASASTSTFTSSSPSLLSSLSTSPSSSSSSSSSLFHPLLILRTWCADVFNGARDSGKGDPGSGCADWGWYTGYEEEEEEEEVEVEEEKEKKDHHPHQHNHDNNSNTHKNNKPFNNLNATPNISSVLFLGRMTLEMTETLLEADEPT